MRSVRLGLAAFVLAPALALTAGSTADALVVPRTLPTPGAGGLVPESVAGDVSVNSTFAEILAANGLDGAVFVPDLVVPALAFYASYKVTSYVLHWADNTLFPANPTPKALAVAEVCRQDAPISASAWTANTYSTLRNDFMLVTNGSGAGNLTQGGQTMGFWQGYAAARPAEDSGSSQTYGHPDWSPSHETPPPMWVPDCSSAMGRAAHAVWFYAATGVPPGISCGGEDWCEGANNGMTELASIWTDRQSECLFGRWLGDGAVWTNEWASPNSFAAAGTAAGCGLGDGTYTSCVEAHDASNPCGLAVRVRQPDGSYVTCTHAACAGWSTQPVTSPATFECVWGGSTIVPIGDCSPLAETYGEPDPQPSSSADPTPSAAPSPQPSSSPSSGPSADPSSGPTSAPTGVPSAGVPGGAGQPDPTNGTDTLSTGDTGGSCFPSGFGVFNPISWIQQPVECALRWAFVPSASAVDEWQGLDIGTRFPFNVFTDSTTLLHPLAALPETCPDWTVHVGTHAYGLLCDSGFVLKMRDYRPLLAAGMLLTVYAPLLWGVWHALLPFAVGRYMPNGATDGALDKVMRGGHE